MTDTAGALLRYEAEAAAWQSYSAQHYAGARAFHETDSSGCRRDGYAPRVIGCQREAALGAERARRALFTAMELKSGRLVIID